MVPRQKQVADSMPVLRVEERSDDVALRRHRALKAFARSGGWIAQLAFERGRSSPARDVAKGLLTVTFWSP